MVVTNQDRVGKGMELLREGLAPFVEREVKAAVTAKRMGQDAILRYVEDPLLGRKPIAQWDVAGLIKLMWGTWEEAFSRILGPAGRSLLGELRDVRNRWAHQNPFTGDDTDRALDTMSRLLAAVSAPQADAVNKMKMELRRQIFTEQVRSEMRKSGGTLIEPSAAAAGGALKPWREIVTPHPDVASGRYQQAEFAADLWQVHIGEGSDEYRRPAEFFRRTYLTESLKRLLVGGVQRIAGKGGDPVVQLQTNFGGGKTHSMLALYHLFGGAKPGDLAGADAVLAEAGVKELPTAKRVVLVGNKISPGNPLKKPDGTMVRTLWGELAWQLGGKAAFDRISEDDARATNPGDALRELFVEYGPSLILIDEWVAYARQLHDQSDLPAGGFETQFTFAQALTESAKNAGNCLLVVSLPASDGSSGDDVEVGGIRGREALDRLRNVVGRLESTWRPASAEEGFEIVRRRLFEPIAGDMFKHRDVTARAFSDLYRSKPGEFPPEAARSAEYEKRIQAAFPIHPEIFDRLYSDWSTLAKFQRTRGVLRLMAAVIHSLWEKGDRSPLIMPATIPIDDQRVQFELTRYLSDNWVPIIEKDVDGANSTPLAIDAQNANLGKLSAARRVARTIYLGSAPTTAAGQRGLEDRRVKLGYAMPGEAPEVFGDALRRLAGAATYLYQDGSRYWYGTQPTVTKLADERAEQLKREPDRIAEELDKRIRRNTKDDGGFSRVHPLPRSGADVPDDLDARLVVLSFDHPYSKDQNCPAEVAAAAILESRGSAPRLFRNTLVFLAADKVRLQDLDEALRKYLAWEQIVAEADTLNLDPHQEKQARTQMQAADSVVAARLPETYQWLLVPEQKDAKSPVALKAYRLTGGDALAVRAAKKLKNDELLIGSLGSTILRKHLDEVPLWRGHHVGVRQLIDDFARYPYLPRLAAPGVLVRAAQDGIGLLTWRTDTFAYAEGFDEVKKRYTGIRAGKEFMLSVDTVGILVQPEVASRQLDSELPTSDSKPAPMPELSPPSGPAPKTYRRFHGAVSIDATRAGRDAGRIAEEVIAHLAGQMAAEVTVTIEIEARLPNGASDQLIRTVTENGRTLKFSSLGFEEE